MESGTLKNLMSKPSALSLTDEKQDFSDSPIHSFTPSTASLLSDNPCGNDLGDPRNDDGTEEDADYQSNLDGYGGSFDVVAEMKRRLSRTKPSKNSRRALEIIERRRGRQPNSVKHCSQPPISTITSVQNTQCVENWSHDFHFDESQVQNQSHIDSVPSPTVSHLVQATVEGRGRYSESIWPCSSMVTAGLDIPLLSGSNINSYTDSGLCSSVMITSTPIFSVKIGSIRSFKDDASFYGLKDSSSISLSDFIIAKELERSATVELLVDISLDSPQFHTCASFIDSPNMVNDKSFAPESCDQSRILVGLGLGPITEISLNSSSSMAQIRDETLISNSPMPDVSNDNGGPGYVTQKPTYLESSVKHNVRPSEIDPIGGLSDTTNVDVDHLIKPTISSPSLPQHSAIAVLKIVDKQSYHSDHLKSPVCTTNPRVRDTKLIKERIERSAALQDKNSRLLLYPPPVQKQNRDNPSMSYSVVTGNLSSSSEDEIEMLRKLGLCSFKLSSDNDPRSPHIPIIDNLLDFTHIYDHRSHNPSCPPQIDPDGEALSLELNTAGPATANPCYPAVPSSFSQEVTLVESKSAEGIGIGLPSELTSQPSGPRDLSSSCSWDEISQDTIPTAEECENLAQLASVPSPNGETALRLNRFPLKRQVQAPLKKMQFLKISKFAKRRLSTIPEYLTTPSKVNLKVRPAPSSPDPGPQDSCANDSNLFHVKRQRPSSWFASARRIVSFLHIKNKFTLSTDKANPTSQIAFDSLYNSSRRQPVPNTNGSPGFVEHAHIPRGLGIFKRGDSPPLASKGNRPLKLSPWRLNLLF